MKDGFTFLFIMLNILCIKISRFARNDKKRIAPVSEGEEIISGATPCRRGDSLFQMFQLKEGTYDDRKKEF